MLHCTQSKSKRVLVILWDRATWHRSQPLKCWLRDPNSLAKQADDGVRLLTNLLPIKSLWLHPMEPIWLHTKSLMALFLLRFSRHVCALIFRLLSMLLLSTYHPDLCNSEQGHAGRARANVTMVFI